MQSSILTLHIDLCKCDWNTINVGVINMCLSLFFFLVGGGFLKDVWTGNSPLRFILKVSSAHFHIYNLCSVRKWCLLYALNASGIRPVGVGSQWANIRDLTIVQNVYLGTGTYASRY